MALSTSSTTLKNPFWAPFPEISCASWHIFTKSFKGLLYFRLVIMFLADDNRLQKRHQEFWIDLWIKKAGIKLFWRARKNRCGCPMHVQRDKNLTFLRAKNEGWLAINLLKACLNVQNMPWNWLVLCLFDRRSCNFWHLTTFHNIHKVRFMGHLF